MTEKPVFRFVGNPCGGVKLQIEIALVVQAFFRYLQKERLTDAVEIMSECGTYLAHLNKALSDAGIRVYSPRWFSEILEP